MLIHNDTAGWYRFIDMTAQAEALFGFIDKTIDTELATELSFLQNYDRTKRKIQEIVDMPDRQIDLFIRFCLHCDTNRLSFSSFFRINDFNLFTTICFGYLFSCNYCFFFFNFCFFRFGSFCTSS